jgi:hypothetical protein
MAKGGLDNHPAKWEVIREWDAWSASHQKEAKMMGGMVFFTHLEKDRPDLLRFPDKGDKWQTVHSWLLRERRVAD